MLMCGTVRPLTDQFPVSTGLQHKTSGVEEEDTGPLVGGASVAGGSGGGNIFSKKVGVVGGCGQWACLVFSW